MPQDTPSRKLDQYIVRFPDGLRDKLKASASENKRSLNAEIVHRLEWSIDEDEARHRANRHYNMLERVADKTIDPDDIADVGDEILAPSPEYTPTDYDHITGQLIELSKQQTALADRVSEMQLSLQQLLREKFA